MIAKTSESAPVTDPPSDLLPRPDDALPPGWLQLYLGEAELNRAFEALEHRNHFHTFTMRGRIRMTQLRFEEAWNLFDEATRRLPPNETVTDLVRAFILEFYKFETLLIQSEELVELDEGVESFIPVLPEELADRYPEVQLAIWLRQSADGLYWLNRGDSERALRVFGSLTQVKPDATTFTSIHLACCYFNLGQFDQGLALLESAGFGCRTCKWRLNELHSATLIAALYDWLEARREAAEWNAYVDRLECPSATKETFRDRARLILLRREQYSRFAVV